MKTRIVLFIVSVLSTQTLLAITVSYNFTNIENTYDRQFHSFGSGVSINDQGVVGFFGTNYFGLDGIYQGNGVTTYRRALNTGPRWDTFERFPDINNHGDIAFVAIRENQVRDREIMFLNGNNQAQQLLVDTTSFLTTVNKGPRIAKNGFVVASGEYGAGEDAVFRVMPGGSIETIANTTASFSGLEFQSLQTPGISSSGNYGVFQGRLDSGQRGVYRFDIGGNLTPIADRSDGFLLPNADAVNDSGTVAGVGLRTDRSTVIYSSSGGAPTIHADSTEYSVLHDPGINNNGNVAFFGRVRDTGLDGIFTGADASRNKVVQVGDVLDGRVVTGLHFDSTGINSRGEIAFRAEFGSDEGIYRATPSSSPPRTDLPAGPLTRKSGQISDQHFRVLSNPENVLDLTKPTIVLTHGFASSSDEWATPMTQRLLARGIDANIVAWDWRDQAFYQQGLHKLPNAAAHTFEQGGFLSDALTAYLGEDYNNNIQFIGHSLGALVNKVAIDSWHDRGHSWANTQATILDAPPQILNRQLDATSPVPNNALVVDNYITAYGSLYGGAVNTLLFKDLPRKIGRYGTGELVGQSIDFHSYPTEWYTNSIVASSTHIPVGFNNSIIFGDLRSAPDGTYYRQNDHDENGLLVEKETWLAANSLIASREIRYIGEAALSARQLLNFVKQVRKVGKVIQSTRKTKGRDQLSLTLVENSPAYAWIEMTIPQDAHYLSFDIEFDSVGPGDFFTVGIGDTLLWSIDGSSLSTEDVVSPGLLDISQWSGSDVELFFGYNSDGITGGSMTLSAIDFFTVQQVSVVPEPASILLAAFGLLSLGAVVLRRRR